MSVYLTRYDVGRLVMKVEKNKVKVVRCSQAAVFIANFNDSFSVKLENI